MLRRSSLAAALGALAWSACSVSDLPVAGKACSADEPCPAPYACAAGTDGERCMRLVELRRGASPTADYSDAQDTTLSEDAPQSALGAAGVVQFDGDEPPDTGMRLVSLLRWGIPAGAVPADARLAAAAVSLTFTNHTDGGAYSLFALRRPWQEASATWMVAEPGRTWESGGASGDTDCATAKVAEVAPDGFGTKRFWLTAEGLSVVRGWLAAPQTNHGLRIEGSYFNGADFVSGESESAADRPTLLLYFE